MLKSLAIVCLGLILGAGTALSAGNTIQATGTGREPFGKSGLVPARAKASKQAEEELFLKVCSKALRLGIGDWSADLYSCISGMFLPNWRQYLVMEKNNPRVLPTRNELNPEPNNGGKDSVCVVAKTAQFDLALLRHDLQEKGCFATPDNIRGSIAVYVQEWSSDNTSMLGSISEIALMDKLRKAGFRVSTVESILKTVAGKPNPFRQMYKRAWSTSYMQDGLWVNPWGAGGWWTWGRAEGGNYYNTPDQVLDFSKADFLLTGKATTQMVETGRARANLTVELVRLKKDQMAVLAEASATGVGTGDSEVATKRALEQAADAAVEQLLNDLIDSGDRK